MFCSTCGVRIDDSSLFCVKCGAKLHRIGTEENKPKISLEKPTDIKNVTEETKEKEKETVTEEMTEEQEEHITTIEDSMKCISALPENHSEDVDMIRQITENYKETPESITTEEETEEYTEQPYYEEDNYNNYDNYGNEGEYYDNYGDIPPSPYSDYPPPPIPQEMPVKVGFFRLLGAFTVNLFTMAFLILISVLFCVKLGFSGDILKKGILSTDMETVLESDTGLKNSTTVNDYLYKETEFNDITMGVGGKSDFKKFVLGLDMTDFIAENISVYADYLLESGKKPTLTAEETADYMFSHSEYSHLNRNDFSVMLANLCHGQTETFLSVDGWKRETGFDFGISAYIFSFITLGIFLAVVIVLMIWTAVITGKRGRYFLGFYKATFTVSGVICLITGLASIIAPPLLYSRTDNVFCYIGSKILMDFGLFILATGAFEFVTGIIFGLIKRLAIKHEEKKQR